MRTLPVAAILALSLAAPPGSVGQPPPPPAKLSSGGPSFQLEASVLAGPRAAPQEPAGQASGLTLQELVDEALRESPAIGAATAGVGVAREAARFARFERIPRLDFVNRYDYLGPKQELPMRGAVFNLRQLQAPFLYNDVLYRFSAAFFVPIYAGGRIEASIGRADFGRGLADEQLRLSKEELVTQVAAGYYRTLQLAEEIRATEASQKSLLEAQRIVREQVEVGKAARVELLKVNTRVAAVEQELIRVRNAHEVARTALTTLLGREGFTDKVQVRGSLEYQARPRELSQHLELAIRQRPELRSQDLAVSIERQNVKIARSALLPNIGVGGFFEGVRGNRSDVFDQEAAFVSVSLPIFSAQNYADVARARVRVKEEEERLRRLRLRIGLEVEEAYLNLDAAEQRVRAAQTALAEAREVLRIEQLKLSVGKGIVQDTLDAQAAALQAENNYSRALADANTSWVLLARATGTVETLRQQP